ncbi:Hypothetical predicted protein [Marmota monax]|uniref:T-cell leukemia translocation-altered gene protein homolog n=1 Tax=Marmota monax TaxID=9995 RepID=A0A5E4B3W0_MARMO|nr:Hypothetical predicted protein [Marmota monax]
MAEPWSGQSLHALPATVLGALGALGSEFLREWEAQDMRVTLFKLLLLWLVLSLLGIQLAWGFYGNTVTGLYHRPDPHPQPAAALDVFLQVWEARMDPHPMAPRIFLRGKWQQMNLSKLTGNKRRQQKSLKRHHEVCWLLQWVLLLPRPQGQLQGVWNWGQRVPQCFQDWASITFRLVSNCPRETLEVRLHCTQAYVPTSQLSSGLKDDAFFIAPDPSAGTTTYTFRVSHFTPSPSEDVAY